MRACLGPLLAGSIACLLLLQTGAGVAPPAHLDADLDLSLDPVSHRIAAQATLAPPPGWDRVLELHPNLRVLDVRVDGDPVTFRSEETPEGAPSRIRIGSTRPGARLVVRYEGEIFDPPEVASFSRERIADQSEGTIQAEGVFLVPDTRWYPRWAGGPGTFRTQVRIPAGWDVVTEGALETREEDEGGITLVYRAAHPTEGLHLVAGPWKRIEREHRGVKVAAYLFPEDEDLADRYLDGVVRYLDMYSEWFGPYPYERFAVVENFFPTGYGMPGFTLLGREVMRLPFIVGTSLGHEVAHNWWGNGVFVDEAAGNWCEGLTTLVADYHYRELQSADAAAEYRRETCRDYTNYVADAAADFPLAEFTERSTPASRAVGYGKTLMVFHMLEQRLGQERFDRVLRRMFRENVHRPVSWRTWEGAFSREAGEDLGWFFEQWVRRPGAPSLAVERVTLRERPAAEGQGLPTFEVRGTLLQPGGVWRLRVPLVLEAGARSERTYVEVRAASAPFRIEASFRPERIRVDPDQNVFRRLDPEEMPPVLSRVLGDPRALVVVQDEAAEGLAGAYREMAETLTRSGMGEVASASKVAPSELSGRMVLLLGLPPEGPLRELLRGLPAGISTDAGGFEVEGQRFEDSGAALLAVGRHPGDPSRAVALFYGLSEAAVRQAGRKLVHYGKYSFLAFVDGQNRAKGVARVVDGPLVVRLK